MQLAMQKSAHNFTDVDCCIPKSTLLHLKQSNADAAHAHSEHKSLVFSYGAGMHTANNVDFKETATNQQQVHFQADHQGCLAS